MSARCKPGDLAVVAGPVNTPGLLGRFVIVEREANDGDFFDGVMFLGGPGGWVCRSAATGVKLPWLIDNGVVVQVICRPIADYALRPIRPNEGEDESLSWARPRVEELA